MFWDISSYINEKDSFWFLTSLSDLPLELELGNLEEIYFAFLMMNDGY